MKKVISLIVVLLIVAGIVGVVYLSQEAKKDQSAESSSASTISENLEKSAWLDMSLNTERFACAGLWITAEDCSKPGQGCNSSSCSTTDHEIDNAVSMLKTYYNFNTIYLIYHKQFPIDVYKQYLQVWKTAADKYSIIIIPSFNLMSYGYTPRINNFSDTEFLDLVSFSSELFNTNSLGIYDVNPSVQYGDYSQQLDYVKQQLPSIAFVRLGAQPNETKADKLMKNISYYVFDTWSYVTACYENDRWENLKKSDLIEDYVNNKINVGYDAALDLIIVGWGYDASETSDSCQFVTDNAQYNDPIPAGRNNLVVNAICENSNKDYLNGFSTDLYILSATTNEIEGGSFNQSLKDGTAYNGKFSGPLEEIKIIFSSNDICKSENSTCLNFTYSSWSECTNGQQKRTVITSTPEGCSGGSPLITQTCAISSEEINCIDQDSNGDGKIALVDLSNLLSKYNSTCTKKDTDYGVCGSQDSNNDGKISLVDLSNLLSKYNKNCE